MKSAFNLLDFFFFEIHIHSQYRIRIQRIKLQRKTTQAEGHHPEYKHRNLQNRNLDYNKHTKMIKARPANPRDNETRQAKRGCCHYWSLRCPFLKDEGEVTEEQPLRIPLAIALLWSLQSTTIRIRTMTGDWKTTHPMTTHTHSHQNKAKQKYYSPTTTNPPDPRETRIGTRSD